MSRAPSLLIWPRSTQSLRALFPAQPGSGTLRVEIRARESGGPGNVCYVGIEVHRKRSQVAVVTE